MSAEWYYTKDGQKYGPLSAAELKELARSGQLAPTDMVWKAGMAEWKVASSVKGLLPASAPASPLPASPASPEPAASAPDEDSFSFVDKVKGRLGKAIGPRGADKLAAAKSFFKKNRLWFGIGTGMAACIILVLYLLPSGILPGGKKSYTQRILDLDSAQQKEYGVSVPKGAKPLYAPGSMEDFVQSLTLFKREYPDIASWDMNYGGSSAVKQVNEDNDIRYTYQIEYLGGVFIKQKCWDMIYGPQQQLKSVNESTGRDRRFGGGSTVLMNHWNVPCTNETVLVRGYSPKYVAYPRATKDEVHVWFLHFNTNYQSICPGKGDDGVRRFSLNKLYKDK